jgi:phosphate-selective porin
MEKKTQEAVTKEATSASEAKKTTDGKDEKKDDHKSSGKVPGPAKEKKWFEKINFRGYTQIRLNETIWRDNSLAAATLVGDRFAGDSQNFGIRRARLIFFGDVSEHLYIYIQPDLAITPTGSPDQNHFAQIRDLYGDMYLTTDKVHRFRIGQSKVPFGWENLQSSQNRLALDRTDAINSAVSRNERDLGLFYYYTPEREQVLFKRLVDDGLKGSGNYGIFGIGVYNGQGGSFLEQNNNLHAVVRASYPVQLSNGEIVEGGIQAYTGRHTVFSSPIRALGAGPSFRPANTLETNGTQGIRDERIALSAIWYPQPFGLQAEWSIGRGPALSDDQRAVLVRQNEGGYIQAMYKYDTPSYGTVIPFVQWTYYRGGYRSERNAPFVGIYEWHIGCEWQIKKAIELTMQYTNTDRTNTTAIDRAGALSYRPFIGGFLRFQCQLNY